MALVAAWARVDWLPEMLREVWQNYLSETSWLPGLADEGRACDILKSWWHTMNNGAITQFTTY